MCRGASNPIGDWQWHVGRPLNSAKIGLDFPPPLQWVFRMRTMRPPVIRPEFEIAAFWLERARCETCSVRCFSNERFAYWQLFHREWRVTADSEIYFYLFFVTLRYLKGKPADWWRIRFGRPPLRIGRRRRPIRFSSMISSWPWSRTTRYMPRHARARNWI